MHWAEPVALISDAGTPLISDPGYKLVRDCYENGIAVTTIPGANAVLSALQLSGLPSNSFYFAGFLPPKSAGRKKVLSTLSQLETTLIIYETPNRLSDMLEDIEATLWNPCIYSGCLNDSPVCPDDEFEIIDNRLQKILGEKFPKKSSFEK